MTRPRLAELDALRALAASIVVVFHLNPTVCIPGWTGVDLFFVLSGYLITTIVLDHFEESWFIAVFYARRGLRIWPIYYLSLMVLVATAPLMPPSRRPPLEGLGYYLTFTQNVTLYQLKPPPKFHPGFEHAWTLALEEQFYVIWPALVALAAWGGWDRLAALAGRTAVRRGLGRKLAVSRRRLRWLLAPSGRNLRIMALCAVLVSMAWMAREGGYLQYARYSERILIGRCDGFALGGLMAVLLIDRRRVAQYLGRYRLAFGLVAVLSFAQIFRKCYTKGLLDYFGLPTPADPAGTILTINLFYFGVVGTVVTLCGHPVLAPLRWRPLCFLGLISYGIYVYHWIVIWAFDGNTTRSEDSFSYGAAKVAVTLALAMASWYLVERPLLSLKDRLRYGAGSERESATPKRAEYASSHEA
ncbi:MAG: acyltransferase [Isosphaeraceae bacterium]|nr:acyltransferase [Isosphaeraceae bacterium]